jgi:transposase
MDSPVYGGALARSVAQRFGVSLSHLQHWIRRAGFLRLDWVQP